MNLASWIILAIVCAVVALALRSTLSKKRAGCCGTHDEADLEHEAGLEHGRDTAPGCDRCACCEGCASAKNCLTPTIKPLE